MSTSVLLVGAGGIGSFYTSRLAQSPNVEVDVICRSNFEAVTENGFSVTSPDFGKYKFVPRKTFSSSKAAHESGSSWGIIVVATKALPDLNDDSKLLEGLVSDDTTIVLIQNGLGIEAPYAKRFPQATIVTAVAIASVAQSSPGQIVHHSFTRLSLGPWLPDIDPNSKTGQRALGKAKQFSQLLQAGGIADAQVYDHINMQFVRWHKIAINGPINPSAVLANGADNPTLVADPELYEHLKAVMVEVLDAAPKVLGQPLPTHLMTPEQILNRTGQAPPGSKASMLVDWESGRPMEVESILGNPIRVAREHGIEMPRFQTLYALIKRADIARKEQQQKEASKSSRNKI